MRNPDSIYEAGKITRVARKRGVHPFVICEEAVIAHENNVKKGMASLGAHRSQYYFHRRRYIAAHPEYATPERR